MKPWIASLALLMSSWLGQSAVAEEVIANDISGQWMFSTAPYRQGACKMTGTLTVYPKASDGPARACEITANEECSFGHSTVVQSCIVHQSGNRISITSEITNILESKPASLGYLPDNFVLTIASSKRMFGALVSAVTASAEFIRPEGSIS